MFRLGRLMCLLLCLSFVSGCVVVDRHGRVDGPRTAGANALIGAALVGGAVLLSDRDRHVHHHHHHHYRVKKRHVRVRVCR